MRIISGRYRGHKVSTVSGPGYRPAMDKVRQALFSMLEARGVDWEQTRVLDLFAGSGSLGLEALSRGSHLVWFVERSKKAAAALRQTLHRLQVPQAKYRILIRETGKVLRQEPPRTFDLVFVDPPYGLDLLNPTLNTLLAASWVQEGSLVAAEVEADLESVHLDGGQQMVNKTYGQTRIILWRVQSQR